MLYQNAVDYLDAQMRLIPLHPIVGGKCGCDDPECPAAGKHPLRQNWTHQRLVDQATLEDIWSEVYQCNGLGFALDKDHFVLDVDSRSGGLESIETLQADLGIDLFAVCSAIVKTGGNGLHFYFKKDASQNLGWKMPAKYRGIDIKQGGGFVVIAGSLHKSGVDYEWYSAKKSDLEGLELVPEGLAALLTRTYSDHRQEMKSSGLGDIDEMQDMLSYINPDAPYETWVKIGMAIHQATDGGALELWESWSRGGSKYKDGECERKWHSFGKYGAANVGTGTLVTIAREAGWEPNNDTNFLSREELEEIKRTWDKRTEERAVLPSMADDSDIDLHEPPGVLGDIYKYVYASSVFPNKNLSLACSLSILTNAIGRKYYMPGRFSNIQPNLLILCIAGSSVGKDSVLGAAHKLLTSIGLGPAMHGRIKSDKDLLDALEANQYAMYFNDEFGQFLQRLNNATSRGSASYLEGIIGTIMEVFTKGDKSVMLDISRKAAINEKWATLINTSKAKLDKGDFDNPKQEQRIQAQLERSKFLLDLFKDGYPNPFLSMFTTATPRSMELAFSGESTENGFLSRAMVFTENETNPLPKEDYSGPVLVPTSLAMKLKYMTFERDACPFGRIDSFQCDRVALKVDHDAHLFIERAIGYFFGLAETQKENGLESLPRRALDGVVKVCIALGSDERRVTLPMARYAVKLVRTEIETKIRRVFSTEGMMSKVKEEKIDGVSSRVLERCDTENGETFSVIHRSVKSSSLTKEALNKILESLYAAGKILKIDQKRSYKEEKVYRYKTVKV